VYAITIHPLKASFPYGCHVMTTRCDIILIQTKQNPQVTTIQTRDLFSRGPRQLHSRCTPVQLTRSYLDAFDLRSRAARRICAAHQPRPRINRDRAWVFPPPRWRYWFTQDSATTLRTFTHITRAKESAFSMTRTCVIIVLYSIDLMYCGVFSVIKN